MEAIENYIKKHSTDSKELVENLKKQIRGTETPSFKFSPGH